MVHTVHPVWGNRSCLRFGIYSEALDDELANRPRFKNRRLRCCVVAGMVLVTALLVGLMVYDMLGGHGTPSRDKDAVQHLLTLRRTTEPTSELKTTIASTFATTTTTTSPTNTNTPVITETTTQVTNVTIQPIDSKNKLSNYHNISTHGHLINEEFLEYSAEETKALPYVGLYDMKDVKLSNRRTGKQKYSEPYDFVSEFSQHRTSPRYSEDTSDLENYKENYPRYWVSSQKRRDPEVQSRIMNHGTQLVPRPFRVKNFTTERPTNNRIKIIKNDVIPYYGFTSLSKYPQLSTYRYPNEAKNIQDIIKYLTAGDSSQSPSLKQHDTLVFHAPPSNGRKIKFAGIYKTAEKEDAGSTYSKPEESMDEYTVSGNGNKMSDTSSLNGHAYIADPFHAFKPSDPSEINLLANSDFRFSPIDNRIRITSNGINGNRWTYAEPNPNDKYFPRPPINFDKPSPTLQNNHGPIAQVYPGTYTTATFKPFGKETGSHSTGSKKSKKVKPFSVMLDIYPMMEDAQPQATTNKVRPKGRPGSHGFGHVRFPHSEHGRFPPDHVAESSETKHQMIVHLNLYPKKKNNPSISNRNDDIPTFHVDVKSNPYCCDEEAERFSRAYGENENEEMRSEHGVEKHGEDGDEENEDKEMAWKLSELADKQKSADIIHPQGIISGDSTTEPQVPAQEDTSLRSKMFETSGGSSQHLMNHRNEEKLYGPLDVRLSPNNPDELTNGNNPNTSEDKTPLISDTSEFYLSADK